MSNKCTAKKLLAFSNKHYTYINQVFGDGTVRQIIEEEYPTTWEFNVAKSGPEFGDSYHHTIKDRDAKEVVCSVMDGDQDLDKDVNDTLCQSYSLMNYFEIPIPSDQKEKQMAMIQMYRDILNGTLDNFKGINFKKKINEEILSQSANKNLWKNYVTKGSVNMNQNILFNNIDNTLDEWEEYGYWYFIGTGECPTNSHKSSNAEGKKIRSRKNKPVTKKSTKKSTKNK
mgnify:CR=1 FL=1